MGGGRETPDPYWGVYVGDFLHNIRSALDHLMCALVIANGKRVSKQTQFPIFTDERDFKVKGAPMMEGASTAARTVIHELQPYHRLHPKEHLLERLRVLSNMDKHQLLHGALINPKDIEHRITRGIGGGRVQIDYIAPRKPLEGEALVLAGRVIPGPGFQQVKMNLQLTAEVILSDGTSLEDFIDPVLAFVRDQVVPRLERFVES